LQPELDEAFRAAEEALEGLGYRSKYYLGKMKKPKLLLEGEAEDEAKRRAEEAERLAKWILLKVVGEEDDEADVPREFEYFSDTELGGGEDEMDLD
jgi:hypothetical protein